MGYSIDQDDVVRETIIKGKEGSVNIVELNASKIVVIHLTDNDGSDIAIDVNKEHLIKTVANLL